MVANQTNAAKDHVYSQSTRYCVPADPTYVSHIGLMATPNANGELHLGHAYVALSEDVWSRLNQLQGHSSRIITGADHGGQSLIMVAKKEYPTEKMTLIEKCRRVFDHYRPIIFETLDLLETQFPLEEHRHSLDDKHRKTVSEVFVKLFEQGYISRKRIPTNWCPLCKTIIPSVEGKPSFTRIHRYLLKLRGEQGGEFVFRIDEPEMLLGQVFAVATDSETETRLKHPLRHDEWIPLVRESEAERLQAGFLYCPESNLEAYQFSKRKNWKTIVSGMYSLHDRLNARDDVVEELILTNAYVQTEAENVRIHRCHCDTKLETLPLEQWVLDLGLVQNQLNITFEISKVVPEFAQIEWENKLGNFVGDWTLSRQTKWGMRPPAHRCNLCQTWYVSLEVPKQCPSCQGQLEQDQDVLDVWFISNVGKITWGQDPGRDQCDSILSSISIGSDTFGVALVRTELLARVLTNRSISERIVVLPILVDEWGRKLSKSMGNAKSVTEYIEQWGADCTRLSLLRVRAWKGKIIFGDYLFVRSRNFLQKLWSVQNFFEHCTHHAGASEGSDLDRWVMQSLLHTLEQEAATLVDAVRKARFWEAVKVLEYVIRKIFSKVIIPYLQWRKESGTLTHHTVELFRTPFLYWITEIWAFAPDSALTIFARFGEKLEDYHLNRWEAPDSKGEWLDFHLFNRVLDKSRVEKKVLMVDSLGAKGEELYPMVEFVITR